MKYSLLASVVASIALISASPASAGKRNINTLDAPEAPCDLGLTTPDAIDCAGYYSGNLINGSPTDLQNQADAIALLDGDFEFDTSAWADVEATKILALTGPDGNQLDFGTTLFGQTIIGAHFGNVAGPAGNVSVFWLFDFGTEGANFVTLDDIEGFSNAVLYTTGTPAVPEPGTWAMMLLGFGAAGYAMRRNRRKLVTQPA
jgi:PEP-CTERM motif